MTVQPTRLFVFGVNERVSSQEIKEKFEEAGEVTDVKNTMNGYAFVTFASRAEAENCIKIHNGRIGFGRPLQIKFAHVPSDASQARTPWYGECVMLKRCKSFNNGGCDQKAFFCEWGVHSCLWCWNKEKINRHHGNTGNCPLKTQHFKDFGRLEPPPPPIEQPNGGRETREVNVTGPAGENIVFVEDVPPEPEVSLVGHGSTEGAAGGEGSQGNSRPGQPRPLQPSPHQPSPHQPSPHQPSPLQPSPGTSEIQNRAGRRVQSSSSAVSSRTSQPSSHKQQQQQLQQQKQQQLLLQQKQQEQQQQEQQLLQQKQQQEQQQQQLLQQKQQQEKQQQQLLQQKQQQEKQQQQLLQQKQQQEKQQQQLLQQKQQQEKQQQQLLQQKQQQEKQQQLLQQKQQQEKQKQQKLLQQKQQQEKQKQQKLLQQKQKQQEQQQQQLLLQQKQQQQQQQQKQRLQNQQQQMSTSFQRCESADPSTTSSSCYPSSTPCSSPYNPLSLSQAKKPAKSGIVSASLSGISGIKSISKHFKSPRSDWHAIQTAPLRKEMYRDLKRMGKQYAVVSSPAFRKCGQGVYPGSMPAKIDLGQQFPLQSPGFSLGVSAAIPGDNEQMKSAQSHDSSLSLHSGMSMHNGGFELAARDNFWPNLDDTYFFNKDAPAAPACVDSTNDSIFTFGSAGANECPSHFSLDQGNLSSFNLGNCDELNLGTSHLAPGFGHQQMDGQMGDHSSFNLGNPDGDNFGTSHMAQGFGHQEMDGQMGNISSFNLGNPGTSHMAQGRNVARKLFDGPQCSGDAAEPVHRPHFLFKPQ